MSDAFWAAREGDGLFHTTWLSDVIAGALEVAVNVLAVAGAVGAVALAAGVSVCTLGAGTVLLIGVVVGAGMALTGAGGWIIEQCERVGNWVSPPTIQARIKTGSEDTYTNSKKAARAAGVPLTAEEIAVAEAAAAAEEAREKSILDIAGGWLQNAGNFIVQTAKQLWRPTVAGAEPAYPRDLDRILCQKHPASPPNWPWLAEGARDVRINSQPAVRSNDRSTCEARVSDEPNGGADVSPDVRIGGPSIVVRDIESGKAPVALILSTLMALLSPGRMGSKLACLGIGVAGSVVTSQAINAIKNPVNAATGSKYLNDEEDLDFTVESYLPFEWQRTYHTLDLRQDGLFGAGWSVPYEVALEPTPGAGDENAYTYIDESGRRLDMEPVLPGAGFRSPGEGLNVRRSDDGRWLIESDEGLYRLFEADPGCPGRQRLCLLGDRNNHAHCLHYDDGGRLIGIADDAGRHALILHYSDSLPRRVVQIDWYRPDRDPECLIRYCYDAAGQLTEVRGPDGELRRYFAYDEGQRMICHRLPGGDTHHYRWQRLDGPEAEEWRVVEHWSEGGEHHWLEYDLAGRRMRVKDSLGRSSDREWNAQNQITRYQDEAGAVVQFDWNEERQLLSHTDAAGGQWKYSYDVLGRLTETCDPLGHIEQTQWHPVWALPLAEIDAEGNTWRSQYDERGNRIVEADPEGRRTRYGYDRHGLIERITDARGGQQFLRWNEDGQLTAHTDCSHSETHYFYDRRGHLESMTNGASETTRYRHDAAGRLTHLIHPDSREERFERDAAGQLLTHTDPRGHTTHYPRDARGQVRARIDAAGRRIEFEYDAYGRLTALVNENGERYRFGYDAKDRLSEQTGVDGARQVFEYDALDHLAAVRFIAMEPVAHRSEHEVLERLVQKTTRDGQRYYATASTTEFIEHRFRRDALGRLIHKSTPDGQTRYAYDKIGRLISVAFQRAGAPDDEAPEALAFTYDTLGQLCAERGDYGVLSHTYDVLGNRLSTILPDGRAINRLYYGSGHLHHINLDGELISDFERDRLHREVLRTQGRLTTRQRYDRSGRLVRRQIARGTTGIVPNVVLDKTYQYDPLSRLIGKAHSQHGQTRYHYDATGRILRVHNEQRAEETQAYDNAANLLAAGQSGPLRGNRLLEYQDHRYTYDGYGRAQSKRSRDQTQYYRYDSEHWLIEVRIERQSGLRKITRYGYRYDPLGRRSEKYRIDEQGALHERIQFLWDGLRLLQETRLIDTQRQPVAPTIPTAAIKAAEQTASLYLYSDEDSYEPLARIDNWPGGNAAYYYHNDCNGAPEELTDANGQRVWETRYQTWGNAIREIHTQSALTPQNLRFQGQYLDRETGLHYNIFRYYDPDIGRFTTPDPIGLAGGLNLYQYAPDPFNWIDPWGWCRRGNAATKKHMDGVRDQFLKENPGAKHGGGGRRARTGAELPETYVKPLGGGRKGGSYADMTFTDTKGRTVYVQTVDKGRVHGMSKREWNNATRITLQDRDAIVITVPKGSTPVPGSMNTSGMSPGIVNVL